jgi:glycosyltransferase involved in cell wall biosynthesis
MEELVDRLGLRDRVVLHGWVNEKKVDELVAKSRCVVFPAVWHEPAGLVTFDASSRGRAVIASRTGGIPEFAMDQRNAILVKPQDDDALIDAMRRVIDDWEFAAKLGATGHALAQSDFSLTRHIVELDQIYRSLPGSPSSFATVVKAADAS